MNCRELLEAMDALIDAELDESERARAREHLDGCEACRLAYEESLRVKRLVERKAFRPMLPGGLQARILRDPQSERARPRSLTRFRAVVAGIAAAALAVITAWSMFRVVYDAPPIAHADAMRELARRYRAFSIRDAGFAVEDPAAAIAAIRDATGLALERFPAIAQARLVSWRAERIFQRPCVCLAYQVGDGRGFEPEKPLILLYAVPIGGRDAPHERGVTECRCVELEDGVVFCFVQMGMSMSVFSSLPPAELRERLEAIQEQGTFK
jgi:mycothiol system anti-sigma-R factor